MYGTLGEKKGKHIPMAQHIEALTKDALAIIALGTCATFGGIAAGKPNPGGYVGVDAFLKSKGIKKPLINIAGCPPHPLHEHTGNTVICIKTETLRRNIMIRMRLYEIRKMRVMV